MKRLTIIRALILSVVLAMGTTACKKRPVGTTAIPGQATGLQNTGPGQGFSNTDTGPNAGELPLGQRPNVDINDESQKDRSTFQGNTVYFGLDSAVVREGERAKVQAVADYLRGNPTRDLLIEGHCDERGTEGYNLSLGDRRAGAIRETLVAAGAPADHVHVISYGETKSAAQGKNEAAYSKNRRGEFVLLKPAR